MSDPRQILVAHNTNRYVGWQNLKHLFPDIMQIEKKIYFDKGKHAYWYAAIM